MSEYSYSNLPYHTYEGGPDFPLLVKHMRCPATLAAALVKNGVGFQSPHGMRRRGIKWWESYSVGRKLFRRFMEIDTADMPLYLCDLKGLCARLGIVYRAQNGMVEMWTLLCTLRLELGL